MRPLPSSRVRIGYEERKGVLLCMEDAILMEADTAVDVCDTGKRVVYGGSTFVLIVVLFILLIIVGRSFCV